jgi:hypothetical protein
VHEAALLVAAGKVEHAHSCSDPAGHGQLVGDRIGDDLKRA